MLSDCRAVLWLVALAKTSLVLAIGLNEIMFDPDGNENTDEFIELYNESALHVNLTGWMISDGEGVDTLVALEQGLIAGPGQYVLILDADYLPSGSSTYDGLVPEAALVVTVSGSTIGSRGLSNSTAETITLINPSGVVVSTCTYTIGNRAGHSDERVLWTVGNDSMNWADAVVRHGTPGGRNSVTPADRDLAIVRMQAHPAIPRPGEDFSLRIVVQNIGLFPLADTLRLYERLLSQEETLVLVRAWVTPSLAPGDSGSYVEGALRASATARRFIATLAGDDDRLDNNLRELAVSPTGLESSVVVNEIMCTPDYGMSEWVELHNNSFSTVSLSGWRFGDGTSISDTTRRFVLPDVSLAPDSFLVLAADSSVFFEQMPLSAQVVVWNSGSVTLNNSGDSLLLWDQTSILVDRVDYRAAWGAAVGKSLERISPRAPSNDYLNWATSLDSAGGTPGRINSRMQLNLSSAGGVLTLEPNPFSPNGDGANDLLVIRYQLEQPDSRLDLIIYDVRGREVRRLARHAAAGYAGEIIWNGTDGRGRPLPTGIYIVYLEALGRGGSQVQSARRVVALARSS